MSPLRTLFKQNIPEMLENEKLCEFCQRFKSKRDGYDEKRLSRAQVDGAMS